MPPRGGRSTSRKESPVSPRKAAHVGARRSTRSQSHDIEARNTAEVSIKSQPDIESPARRTRSKTGAQGLSTVDEENVDLVDLNDDVLDESEQGQYEDDQYSGALSSGSSVYPPNSQGELDALDRTSLVDALPDLYQDSEEVLSLFPFEDPARLEALRRELSLPNSRFSNTLRRKRARFDASRETYRPKVYFIDVKLVVRGFAQAQEWTDVHVGPWRPDAILQLANLVNLIVTSFGGNRDDEDVFQLLESLYKNFPEPYATGFGSENADSEPHGTRLVKETAQLILDIRTQLAVSQLYRKPNIHSSDITSGIFMNDEDRQTLRGFNLLEESDTLPKQYRKMFLGRAREILGCCTEDDVDFDMLESRYGWHDFLISLIKWANLRRQELESQIEDEGGVEAIQERLAGYQLGEKIDLQPKATPKAAQKPMAEPAAGQAQFPVPVPPVRKPFGEPAKMEQRLPGHTRAENRLSAVRERKSRAAQEDVQASVLPPSAQQSTEIPQSPENSPPQLGDDNDVSAPAMAGTQDIPPMSQAARHVLETVKRQALISNKENIDISKKPKPSFINRQPNAQRVEWNDSQTAQSLESRARSGKRQTAEDDEEEDEEEDEDEEDEYTFEDDDRPIKARSLKRVRLQTQREVRTPPLNDDNVGGGDDDDSEQAAIDQQLTQESQRTPRSPLTIRQISSSSRRRPTSRNASILAPHDHPTQRTRSPSNVPPASSQHAIVNRDAKLAAETFRRTIPRPPQSRKAYTDHEVVRLVELIEEHGTSWVAILKADQEHPDGPELGERSQVNIKDKARNLKMDYIKSGHNLPRNFTEIKLGARLEGMLWDLGINIRDYERAQAERMRQDLEEGSDADD